MKLILSGKHLLACLSLAFTATTFVSCKKDLTSTKPKSAAQLQAEAVAAATWQLVWADEFNGTSVSTTNWNFETGAGGWGNNEQQYYRSQNASVSAGNLVITARRESFGGAQ